MKKIISILILLNILCLNFSFAQEITDDFANSTLDKNLKIKKQPMPYYQDDLVLQTLNPNLKIPHYAEFSLEENPIFDISKKSKYQKGDRNEIFDFENIQNNSLKLVPVKYYTTKHNLIEGENINFKLAQDFKINNKTYKQGQNVTARVENIVNNSAWGMPSEVIIDNFVIDDTSLNGQMLRKGANRTGWVYPVGYILSPFFGVGFLVFAIRGGHAKLKPKQVYEVNIDNIK